MDFRPLFAFALASFLAVFVCPVAGAEKTASPPNVIFVMADDLGYGDLGCYGQKRIETPHLDAFAKQGLRFTSFYAGSTVCAPSRCVLMTGYHTGHCLIRGNAKQNLRPEDVTLAEVFKSQGYATGLFGKWGLGHEGSEGVPTRQGFDEFFGYLDQTHAHNYYPTFLMGGERRVGLKNVVPNESPVGAGQASEKVEYSHDLIAERALSFVKKSAGRPFFVYLAWTLPHANNEAGKEGMEVPDLGQYAEKDWPAPQKAHAAMISRMDRDFGRLTALLDELGIAQNTLIFFTSDNGPHKEGGNDPDFNDSNGPLTGTKRALTDGGIRVPMIVRWPGHVPAGAESDAYFCFQDVMPTCAEAIGASDAVPGDVDGVSFLATLTDPASERPPRQPLYWAFYEQGGGQAVRAGSFKAIEQPIGTPVRVYDVVADIAEQHDLAPARPELVQRLTRIMKEEYEPSAEWKFPTPKRK